MISDYNPLSAKPISESCDCFASVQIQTRFLTIGLT